MRDECDFRPSRRAVLRLGAAGLAAGVGYSSAAAAQTLSNEIVISGRGFAGSADYEFTVSGGVEVTTGDNASGSTASGTVWGGEDGYRYSGEITSFSYEGSLRVFVNGTEVDPDTLGSLSEELRIVGTGELATYEFTVSGDLQPGPDFDTDGTDSIDGSTGAGRVNGTSGDDFTFSGEITDFTHDGPLQVFVNDEEVDPDSFGGGSGGELEHTITIRGVNEEHVDYDLTVSGELEKSTAMSASINAGDTISGSSATGFVYGGTDSYGYSGDVTEFGYSGGTIQVFVDGAEVDPDSLGSGTDSGPDRTITIRGVNEEHVDYDLTVSGELEKSTAMSASINSGDTISGSSATGFVYGGTDSYAFSGDITDFGYSGGTIEVFVDGTAVDPDDLGSGTGGGEGTTITFEGSPGGSYDLTVSGTLEKSTAMDASINSGDTVSGSSASGSVGGGRDSYDFTGEIERLRIDDGVTVYLDGEAVDPGGVWAQNARLPRDQSAAGGGVLDGKLYYFGGFTSGPGLAATDQAFVYDPAAGSNGNWSRIEDMPRELWAPCGVSTGSTIYSFGGAPPDGPYSGDPPTDVIYAYTPGDGWTDLTAETGVRCPYPNWAMSGVYDPDRNLVYCVGGGTNVTDRESATDHGSSGNSLGRFDEERIWAFDPATERVADPDFARLPEAKRWSTVGLVEVDGTTYLHAIAGGLGTTGPTASNFRIDLDTGGVTRMSSAPRAAMFATTANPVLNNEIYLTHARFGGEYTTRSYRYDPEADAFAEDVARPEHVRNRAVDGVIDGEIHVVGGHLKTASGGHDATTFNEGYSPPPWRQ